MNRITTMATPSTTPLLPHKPQRLKYLWWCYQIEGSTILVHRTPGRRCGVDRLPTLKAAIEIALLRYGAVDAGDPS